MLLGKIRSDLLCGNLDKLKSSLRRQLNQRQAQPAGQLERLEKRQRQLDRDIDTGAQRLLTAPEELLEILTSKLQQMKRQREQIAAELSKAKQAAKPADVTATVDRLAAKAWALVDELEQAEPARLRELLQQTVQRIELEFTTKQQGRRQIYVPTGGKVLFSELSGFASRGDPRFGFPNDMIERRLFHAAIAQTIAFTVDTFNQLGSKV